MSEDASPRLTVTVGGLAGTGTSTLCRLLSAHLDLPYTYAGQLFRHEAARRGLSLAEFGALCQEDPAVDRSLDDRQLELLREGGVLLEGRMAGWLAHDAGIDAFTLWLTCADEVRFGRIAARDGGDPAAQAAVTRDREASEHARFVAYHGADLRDLSGYDLVLDSTDSSPDELMAAALDAMAAAGLPVHSTH